MAQYDVVVKAVDQTKNTFRGIEAGLTNIETRTKRVNDALNNLGLGIAAFGAAATAALGAAAKSAVTFANQIDDVANATDISARAILGFSAAVQDAGGSSDKALDGILKLNQNISDAAAGSDTLRKAFADVGVSLNDLATLSTEDLLGEVVQGLGQISDKGRQAALATDLLGKSAKGVSFTQAAASIGQFNQQATSAARAQKDIADATAVLEQAFGRLRNRISEAIAPVARFITELDPKTLDTSINAVLGLGAAFAALGTAVIIVRTLRIAILGLTAAIAALSVVAAIPAKLLLLVAGAATAFGLAVANGVEVATHNFKIIVDDLKSAYNWMSKVIGLGDEVAPASATAADFQRTDKDTSPVAVPQATVIRDIVNKDLEALRENISKARAEYSTFLPLLSSKDPAIAAAALEKVSSAAKSLQMAFSDDLILRNYNAQLRDQAETLRQQQVIYSSTANILRESNLELSKQELELKKNAAIIGDSATQQRVFNIELEKNKQTLQQQVNNLQLATAAYDSGKLSLADYLKTLQGVDATLLTVEQRQLQFNSAITKGLSDAAATAEMAGQAMAEAFAAGDMERYLQLYEQYKNVLGTTVTGELAQARKAGRDEVQTMRDRAAALKVLTEEYKANGGTGSAEYRKVAEALGMSTSEIDRMVNVHGSAIDRMVEDAKYYKSSIENAADTFSNEFTNAFKKGENALDSFRNFFSNIANDIANRIIKQQLADPIADALSGIVGQVVGGLGGGGGSSAGGFLGTIVNGVGGFLGDIFGGFFADGGMLGAGQIGIVGEEGPEFITGPANITPMDQISGGDGNLQVVFQIQAIDTQTGAQFLLQNKPLITSMITQAYNSRGRRGPLD